MKLEVLTPIHIGSGEKYLGIDFVVRGDKIAFIDSYKFFSEIERKGRDPVEVARQIADGESPAKFVEDIESMVIRTLPFVGGARRREILEHIKSNGKPYIPGSSIKGAVRTVLLWKVVKENKELLDWTIRYLKQEIEKSKRSRRRIDPRKLDDGLEEKVFRKARISKRENDPKMIC